MTMSSADAAYLEDVEQLKKEMSDRKFKKIRAMEKKINKQMEAMMADPKLEEFNEYRRRILDVKMRSLMSNPKFRDVQEQSARIDEMMKELLSHPKFKEFDDKMQRIDDQLKDVLAEPKFEEQRLRVAEQMKAIAALPEIKELAERIDEELKDKKDEPDFRTIMDRNPSFQELTRITDEKMKEIMADNPHFQQGQERALHIEEEMLQLNSNPEFQKFLELTRKINEEMKVMKAMPNFKQFEEQVKRINEEQTDALNDDPKYKKIQEKAKRIDYQMEKMMAEPHFEEYQQLVMQIAEQTKAQTDTLRAHSLAQLDQKNGRGRSLTLLVPPLAPTSQLDPTHASRPAISDWQSRFVQMKSKLEGVRVSLRTQALEAIRKMTK